MTMECAVILAVGEHYKSFKISLCIILYYRPHMTYNVLVGR